MLQATYLKKTNNLSADERTFNKPKDLYNNASPKNDLNMISHFNNRRIYPQ